MKITDNKRTIRLYMGEWTPTGPGVDCSQDLIDHSDLEYDEDRGVYVCTPDTLDSIIAYAHEWEEGLDDNTLNSDCDQAAIDRRYVTIEDIG